MALRTKAEIRFFVGSTAGSLTPTQKASKTDLAVKMENLSDRLRFLRKEAGVSLSALARSISVTPGYLSQLESGVRSNPSLSRIEKICAFFGVNQDWLIEGRGPQFAELDPAQAAARFLKLHGSAGDPESEGELRKSKVLAEIEIRLSQLTSPNADTWKLYRRQIDAAIDEYAGWCFEHYAAVKQAGLLAARSAHDAERKKPRS